MDILRTIATLLPLAVSSGINLYATVLVAGLFIRFGVIQNPPPGLLPLAEWPVSARNPSVRYVRSTSGMSSLARKALNLSAPPPPTHASGQSVWVKSRTRTVLATATMIVCAWLLSRFIERPAMRGLRRLYERLRGHPRRPEREGVA